MSEPSRFRLIGDPHITRKFELGVPLGRRGEREQSLMADFSTRLLNGDEEIVIMVGDLFEKPICSIADLHWITAAIIGAARMQPEKIFVMMAGNHDISPQKDTYGAFHILQLLTALVDNLYVVTEPILVDRIACFPWQWERTAEQQLEDVKDWSFEIAVGHWDLTIFDPDHTEHLCPAKKLVEMGTKEIYSGHWHVAGDYVVDGVTVHCTGSMQPMSHAEDPKGLLYVTMTLAEYEEADPEDYKYKYVRVLADKDDEVIPLADCLGFKVQRNAVDEDWNGGDVKMDNFKVDDIVAKKLKEHEVPDDVGTFIKERIDATD